MTTTVTIAETPVEVTVQEQAITANITESTTTVTVNNGISDHGALSGLSDDDHTQYLLKTGGTMTGDLVMADNSVVRLVAGAPTPQQADLYFDGDALHFVPVADDRTVVLADGIITGDTTVANTTAETTIYTESISANELHAGQVIRVTLSGYYSTANANDTFTVRWKIGGTTVASKVSAAENASNAPWKAVLELTVRSAGVSGTVQSYVEAAFNNTRDDKAATGTTATDTTLAEDVVATLQWDTENPSDTATLTQGYTEFLG